MVNKDILVYVNGEPFVCSYSIKLADLLSYLDFNTELTTIEYNGEIIFKIKLPTICLKQNDRIEIVTIVGGGVKISNKRSFLQK
uniref:Uncharacterized protein n=1 Tax=Apophlaea sinclairii TaxID=212746 RepID=A0A1C9CBQ5_9FLOR|nr:hypothetical protein Apop_138 [Apophlaea sinclairii]AOM65828.1 hypothetical protein Apop_138 [Apophlaea sinclairii]